MPACRCREAGADYETVLTEAQLDDWLQRLQSAEVFAFDTETTSLDYMAARIVGVSFAVEAGEAAYVPVAHDYPGAPDQLDREACWHGYGLCLKIKITLKLGITLSMIVMYLLIMILSDPALRYDTMLESYVLESTATRHNMDCGGVALP